MSATRQSAAAWCAIDRATLEDIALDALMARDGALALEVLGATHIEHDTAKDGAVSLAGLLDAMEARAKALGERRELGARSSVLQNIITVADAVRTTLRGTR